MIPLPDGGREQSGALYESTQLGGVEDRLDHRGKRPVVAKQEDFGGGKLLIGQDYTPITVFMSNQVWNSDEDLLNFGAAYDSRRPQLKLKIQGFEVALIQPNTGGLIGSDFGAVGGDDTDTTLPKIAMKYTFSTDMFTIMPVAGFNTYTMVRNDGTNELEEDINSYVLGVAAKVKFGPAYVQGDVWFSRNPKSYGLTVRLDHQKSNSGKAMWDGTEVIDCDAMGAILVGGFKVNDTVTLEGGAGYVKAEYDPSNVTIEDDVMAVYFNATIHLAENIFVVPEIGMIDYGDFQVTNQPDDNEGQMTYFGAKWQINF